ncbi:MAG: hypothetical protein IPL61_29850 [Myxococcales bacterium]|nr:hypothetical protein [Myxococcales bacterium]
MRPLAIGAVVIAAAFAVGYATAPAPAANRTVNDRAAITTAARPATRPTPSGRRPIPTVRRFEPVPLPDEDPGVAEIVNGPDEPPAATIAARFDDIDRRLDELFGPEFPAAKRDAIRTALTSWIRDHGRAVRGYYGGFLSQEELSEQVHWNMLGYARSIEASLTRDEYRTFMDLQPGEDPFVVLVPPGTQVGAPLEGTPSPR